MFNNFLETFGTKSTYERTNYTPNKYVHCFNNDVRVGYPQVYC